MIWDRDCSEEKQQEVFEYVLKNGFNIRQAIIQTKHMGKNDETVPRVPPILGNILLLCLKTHQTATLLHLCSNEWVNVWGPKHFQMVANVAARFQMADIIEPFLQSPMAVNHFMQMSTNDKFAFVTRLHQAFGESEEIQKALSAKYYAPYFLLILTERDRFMKLRDYTYYNKALESTTKMELEIIAESSEDHEERFMKFLRHINILGAEDPQKTEGQKFIKVIFDLEKFKAYQNQSLHIFDNESKIMAEDDDLDIVDEGEGIQQVSNKRSVKMIHTNLTHQRVSVREVDLALFHQYIDEKKQKEAIEFLNTYKI